MKKIWMVLLLFAAVLQAQTTVPGTVMLINDSTFILTATVQAADGTYLGQVTLQPGEQANFTSNLTTTSYSRPGAPNVSMTPYTVIWQCPSEGFYSLCNNVGAGAMIRANDCQGARFCSPKKPLPEQKPASTATPNKSK